MSDLLTTLGERLDAIERARERQQYPLVYIYIGDMTPGAIADPPNQLNVVVQRDCDPPPKGAKFTYHSMWAVQKGYEARTVATGINVRRWQKDW